MNVDPADDCTFWYTNEYYSANSAASWRTRIGAFKLPECTPTSPSSDFTLLANPASQAVCAGNAVYTVTVGSLFGFATPVTLSASGQPAGTTANFSPNPVTPPANSILTIGNTSGASPGNYNITITGLAVTRSHTTTVGLTLLGGIPGAVNLTSPPNGATEQSLQPTLSWAAASQAQSYLLQVATDAAFTNIVYTATTTSISHTVGILLNPNTTYYWRVRPSNACGSGGFSPTFNFTTRLAICAIPNLAIPDNNPSGVTSTLTVTNTGTLADLDVSLVATHTWVGDLVFTLTHVTSGTRVTLIDQPGVPATIFGCGGDNIRATLDDEAALPVEDQCAPGTPTISGSFRPNNPLSAFDGQDLSGVWSMRVSDLVGGDSGTLAQWCLLPSSPRKIYLPIIMKN
jgi:hypothetical protein